MVFSIIAGVVIFGYAAWSLVRYVRKTRQGKCAACSLNKTCLSGCSDATYADVSASTMSKL
ncbi:FeoB-associated Cys-rich membrane protein [Paenibacillus tyrfis]|uniref:FeoB-associated Cys-rich membrane protein n=1 Tax=Paenibacillus tyrfis TaxID=1501230 RepID=UPI00248F5D3D|nr:FeoB-associated Cys-rich membrane protein [Paenibacillus tyrfis]